MKVQFITLGCKTNMYETNAMEQIFQNRGYEIINKREQNEKHTKLTNEGSHFGAKPDIVVINTCSVTNIAERKSRQMIRRAKEYNPNAIIVACGCYTQVAKESVEKLSEVDLILGVNEKKSIVDIIEQYIEEKNKLVEISDIMQEKEFQDFGTTTYTELTRTVVKIQDGCDRYCTYCIIPYARGIVRSRKPESILNEIEEITKKGIKEVVITGIHIASYGKDFKEEQSLEYRKKYGYENNSTKFDPKDDLHTGGFRFIELIEQINKIKGIKRIRLGSIEPKLINNDFLKRLSKLEKICPHFHLSLQSGCDETLKRMNRRYTTKEFEENVKLIRKYFKDAMLTTDIIVGFPGETEKEFADTYKFLDKIKFYKMHIFKYSPRKGTKAANMPNQIDGMVKEMRSKKLLELSDKNQIAYNKSLIGKNISVLFEEQEGDYYKGHTSNYVLVKVKTKQKLENKILTVNVIKTDGLEVIGVIE